MAAAWAEAAECRARLEQLEAGLAEARVAAEGLAACVLELRGAAEEEVVVLREGMAKVRRREVADLVITGTPVVLNVCVCSWEKNFC